MKCDLFVGANFAKGSLLSGSCRQRFPDSLDTTSVTYAPAAAVAVICCRSFTLLSVVVVVVVDVVVIVVVVVVVVVIVLEQIL